MKSVRFDDLSRHFAERRFTRRQTVQASVAALAGGAVAGQSPVVASRQATPSTDAPSSHTMYLFLQSFQSGSIAEKPDGSGDYALTLERGLGQTIYFSDRPERNVGAAPTGQFLDGFGFGPESPPNAALLVEGDDGQTAIAVVELTNPTYDDATHTATYDVTGLAEFSEGAGLAFHVEPAGLSAFPPTFGSAHLFIDDCHGEVVACYIGGRPHGYDTRLGYVKATGMCWDQATLTCTECNPAPDILACQAKYPAQCTDANPCEIEQIAP